MLDVFDISRNEVDRMVKNHTLGNFNNPKDVLSNDYLLVSYAVDSDYFDDDKPFVFPALVYITRYGDWEYALKHFLDLEPEFIQTFTDGITKVFCWEIWHLVDDTEISEDVLSQVKELRSIDEDADIYCDDNLDNIFSADFKTSKRCWTIVASFDLRFYDRLRVFQDYMYDEYYMRSMITPINKHDNGLYDVAILFESDNWYTAVDWYLMLVCSVGYLQKVRWMFCKCDYLDNFICFSYSSFGGFPESVKGYDKDVYRRVLNYAASRIEDDKEILITLDELRKAGEVR